MCKLPSFFPKILHGPVVPARRMRLQNTLPLVLLPLVSHGQDALDPLVLTATRSEIRESDSPYWVDSIDSRFISENTRRTLPESLQFVPGVLVQKTAHGHGSPFIRGFTGRQNLLLVDGIRLNNSTWRSGPVQYWNTVDSFSIDRIELVKSQGSVLYGSDAVGGTLNAFTKSSRFAEEEEGSFFSHGAAYYEFRSNGDDSHVGRIESSFGVGGKYGVHLGISAKDYGDIRDSAVGLMRHTGHPEEDLDLRFDMALSDGVTLTLAHQYVNQDGIWRWHRTLSNPGWKHNDHFAVPGTFLSNIYDQERSLTYVRLTGENPEASAWIKRWSGTLSFQNSVESEFQGRTPVDLRRSSIETDTWGLDLGFESDLGPGTLVYGIDYYVDEVSSTASRSSGGAFTFRPGDRPVADDASYHLFGAFTQYTWRPTDRFELTGGVRYTYAEAEWDAYRPQGATADSGGKGSWDDISASLRALYRLNDCWHLYGGVSQAFRAPNLSDLTGTQLALSGLTSHGTPSLDPEEFITAELGVRYQSETLAFSIAGFHTWTDGAITNLTVGTDSFATNGQDGYLYGFEAEAVWLFRPGWQLSTGLAWQEGKTETAANGERWMTRLVPFSGSLALRWTHPSEKFWVEGRVIGAADADRIHPADQAADNQRIPTGGTPGYLVYMLHAGWRPTENFELTCGLENIADDDYRLHGSGQNEPGFGAIVGAKLMW